MKALLPDLQAALPNDVDLMVASDRTTTIRASLKEVERALTISVILVVLVTFAFLRSFRAGLVPSVAVPVSLVGTFGVMYLMGYSLNNLSLMAMTIAAGFVVDDAIIVLENIQRHIEEGMPRVQAALLGAREVGFTVVSMSLSLIAVFIPILLMGGIVGRLFREFAVTLSIAIVISMVISLTTTPMMCAYILKPPRREGREGGEDGEAAGPAGADQRARLHGAAERLRPHPARRAAPSAAHHDRVPRHHHPQHLPVRARSPRASSRSRTPAASSAASAPTRASPSSRCGGSSASSSASSARIRRSRTWSASPAASRPTPASCSPP